MADSAVSTEQWVGRSLPRYEDEALLRGRGRFLDDLNPVPGAHHAAVLRSSQPHARIERLDVERARALPGVAGVLTGAEVQAMSRPFAAACESPVPYYAAAAEVTRYAGEPLAVVVAQNRYLAEDAAELIEVEYAPLGPMVSSQSATSPTAIRTGPSRPPRSRSPGGFASRPGPGCRSSARGWSRTGTRASSA
jgi:2-furoyl-CoA dehydrogenase large subunit